MPNDPTSPRPPRKRSTSGKPPTDATAPDPPKEYISKQDRRQPPGGWEDAIPKEDVPPVGAVEPDPDLEPETTDPGIQIPPPKADRDTVLLGVLEQLSQGLQWLNQRMEALESRGGTTSGTVVVAPSPTPTPAVVATSVNPGPLTVTAAQVAQPAVPPAPTVTLQAPAAPVTVQPVAAQAPPGPPNAGMVHPAPLGGPAMSGGVSEWTLPTDPKEENAPWWWPVIDQPAPFEFTALTTPQMGMQPLPVIVPKGSVPNQTRRTSTTYSKVSIVVDPNAKMVDDDAEAKTRAGLVTHPEVAGAIPTTLYIGETMLALLEEEAARGILPPFYQYRHAGASIPEARRRTATEQRQAPITVPLEPSAPTPVSVPQTPVGFQLGVPLPTTAGVQLYQDTAGFLAAPGAEARATNIQWARSAGAVPTLNGVDLRSNTVVEITGGPAQLPPTVGLITIQEATRDILLNTEEGGTLPVHHTCLVRRMGAVYEATFARINVPGWNRVSDALGPCYVWDWKARRWLVAAVARGGAHLFWFPHGADHPTEVTFPDRGRIRVDWLAGGTLITPRTLVDTSIAVRVPK